MVLLVEWKQMYSRPDYGPDASTPQPDFQQKCRQLVHVPETKMTLATPEFLTIDEDGNWPFCLLAQLYAC